MFAPIAQWIECDPPEVEIEVQILVGAPPHYETYC